MNNKNAIRQHIRAKRKALPLHYQQQASHHICNQITHLTRYQLSRHIAFYLSVEGEVDPSYLLKHAHENGKQCYLPAIHSQKINTLCFLPYKPGDILITNKFDILEPKYEPHQIYPAWQLDIVITPLVAFDKNANRLGMGKGYYDRTLSFLKSAHTASKPYLIGLAYQMQEVEDLTVEAHDIRLDVIVTEKP